MIFKLNLLSLMTNNSLSPKNVVNKRLKKKAQSRRKKVLNLNREMKIKQRFNKSIRLKYSIAHEKILTMEELK